MSPFFNALPFQKVKQIPYEKEIKNYKILADLNLLRVKLCSLA